MWLPAAAFSSDINDIDIFSLYTSSIDHRHKYTNTNSTEIKTRREEDQLELHGHKCWLQLLLLKGNSGIFDLGLHIYMFYNEIIHT